MNKRTDDETLMAEELGRVRALNKLLLHDLEAFKYKAFIHWTALAFLIAPAAVAATFAIVRGLRASGVVTHCYVDDNNTSDNTVSLQGNIDGLPDAHLGVFKSASEAFKEAQAIGCPMWFPIKGR